MALNQTAERISYARKLPAARADLVFYAVLAATGAALWWLCSERVLLLPAFAPWDFSWFEFLSVWLAIWWFCRGLGAVAPQERPSALRQISFFIGVLSIYAVLETRFEYLAEHQFFFNRIQHVILHHFGPLFIALAWPGGTILAGGPKLLRRIVEHPLARGTVRVLQQPALAAFLFSGTFFFWLIPSIHFRAMIDPDLYAIMNWSMAIEGILFWCLVLDPRPCPPARTSFAVRAALTMIVMFPQILGGALIVFTKRDLYTFYDLCGRIYPQLGAHIDQVVGGLIVWIPPSMMSVAALVLVLHMLAKAEGQIVVENDEGASEGRTVIDASRWTGL